MEDTLTSITSGNDKEILGADPTPGVPKASPAAVSAFFAK